MRTHVGIVRSSLFPGIRTCDAVDVRGANDKKCYNPFMKLHNGQPIMMVENDDVECGKANGSVGKFQKIILKKGVRINDLDIVCVDGYWVRCACVSQVQSIIMKSDHDGEMLAIKPNKERTVAIVDFPLAMEGNIRKSTRRVKRRVKFYCFPINIANARTVHKLQGKTLESVVVSSWDYTGNWVYVVLSRVTTLKGLFLRLPLNGEKTRGMSKELKAFLEKWRKTKAPKENRIDVYAKTYGYE